jgi:hypothetical protein
VFFFFIKNFTTVGVPALLILMAIEPVVLEICPIHDNYKKNALIRRVFVENICSRRIRGLLILAQVELAVLKMRAIFDLLAIEISMWPFPCTVTCESL